MIMTSEIPVIIIIIVLAFNINFLNKCNAKQTINIPFLFSKDGNPLSVNAKMYTNPFFLASHRQHQRFKLTDINIILLFVKAKIRFHFANTKCSYHLLDYPLEQLSRN